MCLCELEILNLCMEHTNARDPMFIHLTSELSAPETPADKSSEPLPKARERSSDRM